MTTKTGGNLNDLPFKNKIENQFWQLLALHEHGKTGYKNRDAGATAAATKTQQNRREDELSACIFQKSFWPTNRMLFATRNIKQYFI